MVAEFSARQVVAIAAVAGALVGGVVGGTVAAVSATGNGAGSSPSGGSVTTAAVVRTTLTSTVQVGGSIGYDGSYIVTALRGGGEVYTWLPEPGEVIKQDEPVYSVGDEPVPLLYGSIPAYRAFSVGMSDGADVGQLTHDLIALGYGAGLAQGNRYSSATAAAVQRWQSAVGLSATGEIPLGEVVFEPGPIRVTSVAPSVGAPAGSGTVLTATGTTPIVVVDLGVSEEYLVRSGDAVTVVLPDGTTTVGGHIETVGTVATCPGGAGLGNGAGSADQSPCSSGGGNATPTVTVTVTLDRTPPGAALDQAPVNVNITTQQAAHVLAVPVNALLALVGGGFGVEVVTGNTTRLVGVTTGMFDASLVQVSGSGITVGTRVEVPSS
jgi:peptidoglycan hydrolase-like protein with peptidoglycan-binding domain